MGKRSRNNKSSDESKSKQARMGNNWHQVTAQTTNYRMEACYRGHVIPESEWDAFMASMAQTLPIAFRVSTILGRYKHILRVLENECFGLPKTPQEVEIDGEKLSYQAPQKLPWYSPAGHAFQVSAGKGALRKIAAFQQFRKFLIRENMQGNLTRQETVSMIPPQLLKVEPHHVVLDMCAAPGSKTSQLLEDLHQQGTGVIPTGMVVANDANPDRAYMLVHQLKRLGSPSFVVTTHEGQFFPNLYIPEDSKLASDSLAYENNVSTGRISKMEQDLTSTTTPVVEAGNNNKAVKPLLFDRILCDVPCSGDGTLRKCPIIWSRWNCNEGMGLHPLQVSIAWRAAQMLKVGGKMVYSTCSLNPMENESVVAELIRKSKGALRIVDVSKELPGVIREPGMTNWKTFTKAEFMGKNIEELNAFQKDLVENQGYVVPESGYIPSCKVQCIDSLEAMQKMTPGERAKLKPSFFSPQTLQHFKDNAERVWNENIQNGTEEKNLTEGDMFKFGSYVYDNLMPAEDMHLERCIRILPHRQDTGGFFITLIEKVDVLPSWVKPEDVAKTSTEAVAVEAVDEPVTEVATEATEATETTEATTPSAKDAQKAAKDAKKKERDQRHIWNDAPFVNVNDDIVSSITSQFGLKLDGKLGRKNMFCRSQVAEGNANKIYFLSDTMGELVNTPHNFRLKIVQSGLRIFEVAHNAKDKATKYKNADHVVGDAFRVCQDGLQFVLPYLNKQVMHITKEDFKILLEAPNGALNHQLSAPMREMLSYIPDFDEKYTGVDPNATVDEDNIVHNSILELGSFVIRITGSEIPDESLGNQVVTAAWRTPVSVNLMIDPTERDALLFHFSEN